jgi:hypothetical protein
MLAPSPFGSRDDDVDAFLLLGSRESGAAVVVVVSGEEEPCSGVAEAVLSPGFAEEDDEGTGGGIESPPEASVPGVSEGEELSDLVATMPVLVVPIGFVSEPARDRIPAGLIDGADELVVYAGFADPAPYTPRIDDCCVEGCIPCCC